MICILFLHRFRLDNYFYRLNHFALPVPCTDRYTTIFGIGLWNVINQMKLGYSILTELLPD